MASTIPKFDPELTPFYDAYPLPGVMTLEMLPTVRPALDAMHTLQTALGDRPFTHQEEFAQEGDGPQVPLSVFSPKSEAGKSSGRPCIYFIHAGGLILSNRFCGVGEVLGAAQEVNATVVSVEYRLGPEHPAPAALHDSLQGLTWVHQNADKLGVDPAKIVVWGSSAGGGLAAAVGLLLRDRKSAIQLKGLILNAPMLDNKPDESELTLFSGDAAKIWSAETNTMAWKAYLGDDEATGRDPYHVPSRATDLSGLPPTFLDVGAAELFRKSVVRFAERMWENGGTVELHVWPGAYHGSDIVVPGARISQKAIAARKAFAQQLLSS